jgi:hypothetical protein
MTESQFEHAPAFDLTFASPEEQEVLSDLERFIRLDPKAAKTVVDLFAKQSRELESMSPELKEFLRNNLEFGADVLFGLTEVIKGQSDLNLDFDPTTKQAIKENPRYAQLDNDRKSSPEAAKQMRILRIGTYIGRVLKEAGIEEDEPNGSDANAA